MLRRCCRRRDDQVVRTPATTIVPEFTASTEFKLDASRLLEQLTEAKAQGVKAKPVIIGPVTYLWLGKREG